MKLSLQLCTPICYPYWKSCMYNNAARNNKSPTKVNVYPDMHWWNNYQLSPSLRLTSVIAWARHTILFLNIRGGVLFAIKRTGILEVLKRISRGRYHSTLSSLHYDDNLLNVRDLWLTAPGWVWASSLWYGKYEATLNNWN